MIKRLWVGITWPSAIITLVFGIWVLLKGNWDSTVFQAPGRWLLIKLIFVAGLYLYHFTLHTLYRQQLGGVFKYSSQKLRIWNEVATILLIAIVMLATVKQSISFIWGLVGLTGFVIVLMSAIKIYKATRNR